MNEVTVVVEPRHHVFTGELGSSVMAAANAAGFLWPTVCGGQGLCTTCFIIVLAGADNLSPMAEPERTMLAETRLRFPGLADDQVRLACQARLRGPVRVRKPGVRPRPAGGA